MRVLLAALALAACSDTAPPEASPASPAPAANAWTVDKAASRLSFTATQTGTAFTGEFETFTAEIVFDPADLEDASIKVIVDVTSAATGDRQRDAALPGSDWFRARDFPVATFVSDDVVATGEGAYEARGRLTMRDATRDLALPFSLSIEGERAHAEGAVTLLRTDYGVGQGEFATDEWVGLEVGVSFVIEASR